jgi:3-oxoacyl-(acyl-carrier-protein) synthase
VTLGIYNPTLLNTAGRIAIVGFGAVNALGTGETSYLTRTGRFEEALPEYRRIMGVADGPDARALIDRNIGIRTPRPADVEDGYDIQRFQGFRGVRYDRDILIGEQRYSKGQVLNGVRLDKDVVIEGKKYPKGSVLEGVTLDQDLVVGGQVIPKGQEILLPRTWKLPVCHAGVLPSGWNLLSEMGLSGKPFNEFSRAHLIMVRTLADAMVSMGIDWSVIEQRIAPEQRKVAAGPGMAPGKHIRDGMVNPYLSRKIEMDQLAKYLADNPAFWLAKLLDARHASTRIGACNTGICNMEDLVAAMRTGEILFGAVATFESAINETSIIGFNEQKALATDRSVAMLKDHPSLISRAGLANRAGFVMGEGGGLLFLMNWDLAVELGAVIYGEMLSARTALGEYQSSDPAAPTRGVILAMARGLLEAAKLDEVTPQQFIQSLDFINGHGTSTGVGDINGMVCYDALLNEFGRDRRRPVWVVYAKGGPRLEGIASAREVGGNGTGHLLGGAASAATVENISIHEEGILPAAVSSLNEVEPAYLQGGKYAGKEYEPVRHLLYTTAPTRTDAEVGVAEAEGFGDSNGVAWSRKHRSERYRGGRENEAKQAEARARRDENFAAIRSGAKRPGDFVPALKKK